MSHIFVSYSRKDSTCVSQVVDTMTQRDFPTWIDTERIKITESWLEKIEHAIEEAFLFMLFWSKDAAASDYVKHELGIAKQLQIEGKLAILVVMLDETELPMKHIQAYNLKHGCTPVSIATFINTLKPEWRQFSRTKLLASQNHRLVSPAWASVLYDHSTECNAYIVGSPNAVLPRAPRHLAVCLQFFRAVQEDMLSSVFPTLPPDAWALHITGPTQIDNRTNALSYGLDNNNPAQWEACRAFIVKSIQSVGSQSTTTLHVYALTPNALLGGVTMPFNRFWHMKLYNFVAQGNTYVEALDLPRF